MFLGKKTIIPLFKRGIFLAAEKIPQLLADGGTVVVDVLDFAVPFVGGGKTAFFQLLFVFKDDVGGLVIR